MNRSCVRSSVGTQISATRIKVFIGDSDCAIAGRVSRTGHARISPRRACSMFASMFLVDRHPDLAVPPERDWIDLQAAALGTEPLPGPQVEAALVQRADHRRAADEAVGERPPLVGTFALRGEDLAGLGVEHRD